MKLYKGLKCAFIAFLMVPVSSCDLEVIPPAEIAAESFWKTEKDAWYGLNACYAQMPGFSITNELYTDNAHSHKPWEGPFELLQTDGISIENDMGYNYNTIRIVNNFLERVDACAITEAMAERMKAEARFFRALEYLTLTTRFGKVPLVTATMNYDAPTVPRDPKEMIEKFILDELNEIAAILPDKYTGGFLQETGRITRAAALTLRARAALCFNQFAIAEEAAGKVIAEGNHSLFRLTTLNAAQHKEADEMEQLIDFKAKGIDKDKFMKGMFSYESLWFKENANPANPEYILTHEYMADDKNCDWARYIYMRPSQLVLGYASYEPMQGLIDAYWDIDGKTIRPEISLQTRVDDFNQISGLMTGLDQTEYIKKVATMNVSEYPYMNEFRNRDSRLYASILFPFKGWHETDFGTFYYRADPKTIGTDGNEMWTGYAFRKMVTLSPYNTESTEEDYPVIRYAEVLLTYAEARIQNVGWDTEVKKALNDLRDRCGMPDVPATMGSKQAALDFVRNERRIELAGEGQRFDDMRRYGPEYCAKVMAGPTYAPNGYLVINKSWSNRLMLMPIPQSAIDLNPKLAGDQNPGY